MHVTSARDFASLTPAEINRLTPEESPAVMEMTITSLKVLPQGKEQAELAYRKLLMDGDF